MWAVTVHDVASGGLPHVGPPHCQESGAKTGSHEQQKEALPPRKPQRGLSQQEM